MTTQTIKKLSTLLELADQTASAAAFNLNTFSRRITATSTEIQKEIDREASIVKGGINYILQAKQVLSELQNDNVAGPIVELWLVKEDDNEKDFESARFVWPFTSLPVAGDKIETLNVIQKLCPSITNEFLQTDYYKVLYTFFEVDGEGNYYQTIRLTDNWLNA